MFIQFTRNLTIDIPAFTAFTCNVVSSIQPWIYLYFYFHRCHRCRLCCSNRTKPSWFIVAKLPIWVSEPRRRKQKSNEIDRWDKNCSLSLRNECFLTLLLLLLLQLEWIEYWLWNGWRRGQMFGDWLKSILIGDVRQRIHCSIGCCVTETASLCKDVALLLFSGFCTIGE